MTQWVKCIERLPDKFGSYLVYLNGHGIHIRYYSHGLFFKRYYDAWQIYQMPENKKIPKYKIKKPLSTVTHWMPIPPAPQPPEAEC